MSDCISLMLKENLHRLKGFVLSSVLRETSERSTLMLSSQILYVSTILKVVEYFHFQVNLYFYTTAFI